MDINLLFDITNQNKYYASESLIYHEKKNMKCKKYYNTILKIFSRINYWSKMYFLLFYYYHFFFNKILFMSIKINIITLSTFVIVLYKS